MPTPIHAAPERKYRLLYFLYVSWLASLFIYLIVRTIVSSGLDPLPLVGLLFYFCIGASLSFLTISRYPLKLKLHGNTLTTRSLRGMRHVQLDKLAKVQHVMLVFNRDGGVYLLKLVDTDKGYAFVHFGSLPRAQRKLVHTKIAESVQAAPHVKVAPFTRSVLAKGAVIEFKP